MKIKMGDRVYLQKYDVAFITSRSSGFPWSIIDEIFTNDKLFYVSSKADGYKFKCEFKDHENVKWLMEQDWIVDYDECAKLSNSDLEALIEHLEKNYHEGLDEFNAQSEHYRKNHFKEKADMFEKSKHKIISYEYMLAARRGEIKFVFPYDDESISASKKKKHGFFKWLFG